VTIRDYLPEDLDQIKKLAEKYKINLPIEGKVIVSVTNSGKIEGFIVLRNVLMIEPFICENPIMANKLWDYVKEKVESGGVKIIRCFAQPRHEKLYKKLGFYRIFKEFKSMEINFYK